MLRVSRAPAPPTLDDENRSRRIRQLLPPIHCATRSSPADVPWGAILSKKSLLGLMMWTLAVVGMQGRTNFGGTLLKWALCLEGNAAALRAGRRNWHRLGSRRDGARTSSEANCGCACDPRGRTISSRGPRRSITSRSVFMAQDVVETSGRRYQPSRLSRCGEARHDGRHELASRPQRRRLEAGTLDQAGQARQDAL